MYKSYPCTLRGLEEALGDAHYRSIGGPPQIVVRVDGRRRRIIRRFEHGREVPLENPEP